MINLRGKLCWSKIRICFLSLCTVLMGNEIWDLNDLTDSKTVLLLTAQFKQSNKKGIQTYEQGIWVSWYLILTTPSTSWSETVFPSVWVRELVMHLLNTGHQSPFAFTDVLWWGGIFSLDLSLLKLSPSQVVPNQSVPMHLGAQWCLGALTSWLHPWCSCCSTTGFSRTRLESEWPLTWLLTTTIVTASAIRE